MAVSGEYRKQTIKKTLTINGVNFYGNSYVNKTITLKDIRNSFSGITTTGNIHVSYPSITNSVFATLSSVEYVTRRDALLSIEPDMTSSQLSVMKSSSTGVDLVACPIIAVSTTQPITTAAVTTAAVTTATPTTAVPITFWAFGLGGKVFKTINGGVTWVDKSISSGVDPNINSLVVVYNGCFCGNVGYLLAITNSPTVLVKLYKTIDGGDSWVSLTVPSQNVVSLITIDANNVILGTYFTETVVYKSSNGGNLFTSTFKGGISFTNYRMDFATSSTGYSTDVFPNNSIRVAKTTNGGSFIDVTPPLLTSFVMDVSFVGDVGYIANENNVWKTSNGGSSWNKLGYILPGNNPATPDNINSIYVYFIKQLNNGVVIAAGINNSATAIKIARSVDGGLNWVTSSFGIADGYSSTNYYATQLDFYDNNNGILVLSNAGTSSSGGVLRTSDGGLNWSLSQTGSATPLKAISRSRAPIL
jgi:photosystem II stability/assembly factor-like uncharacterized protein